MYFRVPHGASCDTVAFSSAYVKLACEVVRFLHVLCCAFEGLCMFWKGFMLNVAPSSRSGSA